MKCPYCKGDVEPNQKYCGSCGRKNSWYVENKKPLDETYSINEDEYKTEDAETEKHYDDIDNNNAPSQANSNSNYNQNSSSYQKEPIGLSVCALVFGLLGGWLGLILGIIALSKNKDPGNRTRAIIGIVAWACWMVIYYIYG